MPVHRSHVLLWAALSGVLWALAWPAVGGITALAFVAWLPLLHAERLHDLRTAARPRTFLPYVLLAVFIWNAACSWWFFGVNEPLATRMVSGLAPMTVNSLLMLIPWWLKRATRRMAGDRVAAIAFIAYWLAFERLHHGWDLQWPWFSIGNVFGTQPHWIQWYEVTGMLGGSLWVLLVTFFLHQAINTWRSARRVVLFNTTCAAVLLIVPPSLSIWRFNTIRGQQGRAIEAVVVQPNIDPYTEKFGGVDPLRQLDRMLVLAQSAMTDSTALVVFPETALQEGATVDMSGPEPMYNGLWENAIDQARSTIQLRRFQDRHPRTALITGMSADELHPRGSTPPPPARPLFREEGLPPGEQRWYTAYNAALFLPAQGSVEVYNKSKLVAGVELMPFESVLGQLDALSVDLGGVSGSLGSQQEREVLEDPSSGIRLVPAICYESVFGEHVAAHVRNGGNLIAVITNDAWWGDTPGYRQHLTFSTIRAIETRRDVVRSANTGISCFVDRRGVVHQPTAWWVPTAERRTVHLNDELTFFVRHGDLVGKGAVALSILSLIVSLGIRLSGRRAAPQE
ncbi:MAG: apolipoprotein N-acyltransferase [Flavobacteriales bacterium]|jgi:apolipoprotein N-acyltransferase|nr:MAG: apolipoprotein N-acyltransferase [Flavobacteriales bacterium]